MIPFLRRLLLGSTLFFGLGCMGLVNDLAGLDLEMAMGENAVHPADFEVKPPSTGRPELSMSMTTDAESVNLPKGIDVELAPGTLYKLEMIAYEDVDVEAERAVAITTMAATTYTRQEDVQGYASYAKPDGTLFVVAADEMMGSTSLSLIRLTPQAPEDPPSAAE